MTINIIIPVLNEECDLENNVNKTIEFLNQTEMVGNYRITIIDNGSTDRTKDISEALKNKNQGIVYYIRLEEKGVGLAFRTGIISNTCDIVGYMDLDLATDLRHLIEIYNYFDAEKTEIVVGSRLLKNSVVIGRSLKRNITSRGLNIILKLLLHVNFTDAMCGFKFYRNRTAKKLVSISSKSNGWFYCAEMMIRAEWIDLEINELPITWTDDINSKVKIGKLTKSYLKEIFELYKEKKGK